ncbi:unnamed protein product [Arctogadus glacialis]
MNTNDAKEYLAKREIPQLFESLLTGLMYYRPDDPVDYLEVCLRKVRELGGSEKVRWDTFVGQEKKSLPPLNGGQSRRSLFRNVLPDSPNFPYRRYDRLPPISQFSIESDSDLSETAELIEEYEVFDPARPRPKVILVIGGPGSGKGTQSLKIAERYGFQYVSVGELLRRKMIHNATSNRKWSLIAKIITNGELAEKALSPRPITTLSTVYLRETTITEIKQKIMKIPDAAGIVIDGFPRDVGQALSFEDQICTPDLVVFLACANHRLKERLERRAELQGRPDDNPRATERRLTNFKQNTIPLVKYFQERGPIATFDADRDEEEVFSDISTTLDSKLFPFKSRVAGPGELDLSLLGEPNSLPDAPCKYDGEPRSSLGGSGVHSLLCLNLHGCFLSQHTVKLLAESVAPVGYEELPVDIVSFCCVTSPNGFPHGHNASIMQVGERGEEARGVLKPSFVSLLVYRGEASQVDEEGEEEEEEEVEEIGYSEATAESSDCTDVRKPKVIFMIEIN